MIEEAQMALKELDDKYLAIVRKIPAARAGSSRGLQELEQLLTDTLQLPESLKQLATFLRVIALPMRDGNRRSYGKLVDFAFGCEHRSLLLLLADSGATEQALQVVNLLRLTIDAGKYKVKPIGGELVRENPSAKRVGRNAGTRSARNKRASTSNADVADQSSLRISNEPPKTVPIQIAAAGNVSTVTYAGVVGVSASPIYDVVKPVVDSRPEGYNVGRKARRAIYRPLTSPTAASSTPSMNPEKCAKLAFRIARNHTMVQKNPPSAAKQNGPKPKITIMTKPPAMAAPAAIVAAAAPVATPVAAATAPVAAPVAIVVAAAPAATPVVVPVAPAEATATAAVDIMAPKASWAKICGSDSDE